jgi:TolB protein
VEATINDVPWSKVGPGWTLATWSPVIAHQPGEERAPGEPDPKTAATTLYLVDPAGNRYAITTFSGADARLDLADWSGDGRHALFDSTGHPWVISIDLHTGEQTRIPIDKGYARYARPDGKALLVSTHVNGNEPAALKRIDLAGNEQVRYPTEDLGGAGQFSGRYLESPDGTQLVLGTANLGNELVPRSDDSLVVVGSDGEIIRTLPTPMPNADCAPMRWWAPTVVLARCSAEHGSASQLWKVPIDGGAPTALTAVHSEDDPGFDGSIGEGLAWELPSGTFLQSAGACGTAFLSRLTPDGHTTRVDVPGMSDSVFVTGATTDKLVLEGHLDCGGGTALVSYDPAANTSTVLLGPPVNVGGVKETILFPEGK